MGLYRDLGLSLREPTDGPVRVASFGTPSAEFHLIVREERGSPADALLDAVGRRSAPHVAFGVPDLGPYRRAFVAPEGHVGVPFEFVEPR